MLTLGREPGVVLRLLPLGATVQSVEVTGGDGVRRNVTLNHADEAQYLASTAYFGATVGRYANRIAHGRFSLDGEPFTVGTHDRGHSLHGGPDGFDRRNWTVERADAGSATLSLISPDGDQGFPGELSARVEFRVEGDSVSIAFSATTDRPTVVNLTNHAYFNLDGIGAGTVDEHELRLAASRYTPIDASAIPLGAHAEVAGTPFDFRSARLIGPAVRTDHPQIRAAAGIDHNFVLDGGADAPAAELTSRRTRTILALRTDRPGLQVYTGNFLDGSLVAANGARLRQGDGIALEPQLFPDSPNRPDFPSATLRPGQTYQARLSWTFSTF